MSISSFSQGAAGFPLGTWVAKRYHLGGLQGVREQYPRLGYSQPRRKRLLHGVLPFVHTQGPRGEYGTNEGEVDGESKMQRWGIGKELGADLAAQPMMAVAAWLRHLATAFTMPTTT